jgi:hypothetical protein
LTCSLLSVMFVEGEVEAKNLKASEEDEIVT